MWVSLMAFTSDTLTPSSKLSYATRPNWQRYLHNWRANLVLPLPELPQTIHDPVNSGHPMASFHSPSKGSTLNLVRNT